MLVQMFTVGSFFSNCYVVACENTKETIIVDPGFDTDAEAQEILRAITCNRLRPRLILDTHGHPDHSCGNGIVKEKFNVPILIHESDAHMIGVRGKKLAESFGFYNFSPEADRYVHDGDTVALGNLVFKVMHTPGHSRGSICLIGEKTIFTGDTLFEGSIGRTDFPEGSEEDMKLSLRKLAELPEDYAVYPGHGAKTTIGNEKRFNPFLTWAKS